VEIIAIFVAGCGAVLAFGIAMIALGLIWDLLVAIWKIVDAILDIAIELILLPFRVVSIFIDAIFGADEEPPQRVVPYREVEQPPPPQRPQPEVRYSPPLRLNRSRGTRQIGPRYPSGTRSHATGHVRGAGSTAAGKGTRASSMFTISI